MGVEPMNKRSSPMVVVSAWCCNFNTRPVCYTSATPNILFSYLSVHTFYIITYSITMLYWFWLHKYYFAHVFIVNLYQEGGWDAASLPRPCPAVHVQFHSGHGAKDLWNEAIGRVMFDSCWSSCNGTREERSKRGGEHKGCMFTNQMIWWHPEDVGS